VIALCSPRAVRVIAEGGSRGAPSLPAKDAPQEERHVSNLPALPDRPERSPADLAWGLPGPSRFLFEVALGVDWRRFAQRKENARRSAQAELVELVREELSADVSVRSVAALGSLLALSHSACGSHDSGAARRDAASVCAAASLAQDRRLSKAREVRPPGTWDLDLPDDALHALGCLAQLVLSSCPGSEERQAYPLGWTLFDPSGGYQFVTVRDFLEASRGDAILAQEIASRSPSPSFGVRRPGAPLGVDPWADSRWPGSWDELVTHFLGKAEREVDRLLIADPKPVEELPTKEPQAGALEVVEVVVSLGQELRGKRQLTVNGVGLTFKDGRLDPKPLTLGRSFAKAFWNSAQGLSAEVTESGRDKMATALKESLVEGLQLTRSDKGLLEITTPSGVVLRAEPPKPA